MVRTLYYSKCIARSAKKKKKKQYNNKGADTVAESTELVVEEYISAISF